jgi:predicted RND superfamily exporter protein
MENDLERRMEYTLKTAYKQLLMTSSTTAVAFLANIGSTQPLIRAFGIFSSITIPVNFVLALTFFPPFVVFWERNFKEKNFFCDCCYTCCKKKQNTRIVRVIEAGE